MQSYHLTDEFTDIVAEQALLASLMQSPVLYWDLLDLLTSEVFTKEADTWKTLARAFETGHPPSMSADWLPAPDPHATAQRLVDLHQRRLLAAAATRHVPVVVVTFEHAPANLTLKLLCARAGVNLRDVQRGYADLAKLQAAAEACAPVAQRLAVVEGSSQLTVAQVCAQVRRALGQHQTERCLVVV